MLKAKRKTVITSLVAMIGVLVGALSVSLTWFAKMNSIDDLEIGGSVLKQYFDSGTGTQADPFVITRPKHWENLVSNELFPETVIVVPFRLIVYRPLAPTSIEP